MKAKTILAGILVDLMGCIGKPPEEEYEEHTKDFAELLRPNKVKFYRMMNAGEIKPGTSVLIFDYGGMAQYGSGDLVAGEARALLKWAQDNPSSLLIVATVFTYQNAVKYEMEDLGLTLPNVVCRASILEDPIPLWFRAQTAPSVTPPKQSSLDVPKNLHAMAGLTPINHKPLPSHQFFKPGQPFLEWFLKEFGSEHVYEAGAGMGHTAKALADAGQRHIEAIDANARAGSVFKIKLGDATAYRFLSDSVVLICRPCHGMFCEAVIQNALFRRASAIVYVGLTKNVENDLGAFLPFFSAELTHAGEDGEVAYAWRPEWNKP